MKQCQKCGSPTRVEAELVEGQRRYQWYKCTNMQCGATFLIQERAVKTPSVVSHPEEMNTHTAV